LKVLNIFCFGFGQVAKNFINTINSKNYNINLSVTTTHKTSKKSFNGINLKNYFFKDEEYDKNLLIELKQADHILISIPPIKGEDLVLKNFLKTIEFSKVKWVTYLSATSVYGDHKGNWVNEDSETKPKTQNGIARLKAEKLWLSLNIKKKLPIQVFRLSGIYSNEKNILIRLKSGTVKLINNKNKYFSRIHLEDIANILFESLLKFKSGEIYNLADDKPSTSQELTEYACKILNIPDLEKIKIDETEGEMLKNFYKESKKVCNKKVKSFFNYNLKFSTYVEGLDYIRDNFI